METDTLVYQGGAVKALGNGRVGGHLVLFSTAADPDLTGDYFTQATTFKIDKNPSPILLYEHAMDPKLGDREIGEAKASVDGVGVWVEAQLAMRDAYEEAIYKLAEAGKLGWSSGTAGHLVRRKKVGKSFEVTSWPIVEASLTTHPAEPRTAAVPLKSLYPDGLVAGPSFPERSSALVAGVTEYRDLVAKFYDQRIKAGRELSAANCGSIESVANSIDESASTLQNVSRQLREMIARASQPKPVPAADVASPDPESEARWKAVRLTLLRFKYADMLRTV